MTVANREILIVEDEADSADVISRIFRREGIPSVTAVTGEDALELLRHEPGRFQAVVIDLALPNMDGFELLTHIRSEQSLRHMRIIGVTAFYTPELEQRAEQYGFDAFFPKPLNPRKLTGALI